MKHLTIEEMISFVSISKLNDTSLNLASKVNTHIIKCTECRNKVRAFQDVFDGLCRAGRIGNENGNIYVDELIREMEDTIEVSNEKEENDSYGKAER